MTGLSIGLMDRFDTYRARSMQLITESQFPTDVAMSLRQKVNASIDATIALIAANPPEPEVLITPAPLQLPNFTVPEPPVLVLDLTPAAPAGGAQASA
jgi:hypothetical protein